MIWRSLPSWRCDLKISIVAGSHRHESESGRVARYIEAVLQRIGADRTWVLSLSGNPLPLWDEGVWEDDPKWAALWNPIAAELASSDGLVVVCAGVVGDGPGRAEELLPALRRRTSWRTSPGMIVAVSASMGGAYPIVELRTSSYKNTRLCYIPDHVIVRNVGRMLKGDQPADEHDASLRARIEYSLGVLLQYAKALRAVRASDAIDLKRFPYGM